MLALLKLAGAAALGFWFLHRNTETAKGPGPFQKLPLGVKGKPLVNNVQASSGRKYKVSSYPIDKSTGTDYSVAQLEGTPNSWIGYKRNVASGARTFVQGNATGETELANMLADFGVVR